MKRFFALFLCFIFIFSLSSCSIDTSDVLDTADVILDVLDDDEAGDESYDYDIVLLPNEDEEVTEEEDSSEPEQIIEQEEEQVEDTSEPEGDEQEAEEGNNEAAAIDEDGSYTSKDDVALYIHTYGHLPSNFITKKEAEKLGWSGGSLEPYAPGKSIGGTHFGNYAGLLPEKDGRKYTECDIDTMGAKSRGAKRIVFSNDGLIYYTDDHYESFTLLYGSEILDGE